MKPYIRFEVEKSLYSRNHLIGVYKDGDKEKRDRILSVNSCIEKEDADKMISELQKIYQLTIDVRNKFIKK